MKLIRSFQAAAILLPLLLVAPALSQNAQPRGQARGGSSQGRAEPRRAPPGNQPAEGQRRPAQPRPAQPRETPPPTAQRPAPPAAQRPAEGQRPARQAVPRSHAPGASPQRRAYREPGIYRYQRPRVVVPVIVYPRPYYVFRPRYWLGFGIYLGFPVPYPVVFGYPAYVYSGGDVLVQPSESAAYGGISFTITPGSAAVLVDGVYVGLASDFSPTHQPLTLTPGLHHVELQSPDMVPLAFDVEIVAGEVLPFSGTLQPQ